MTTAILLVQQLADVLGAPSGYFGRSNRPGFWQFHSASGPEVIRLYPAVADDELVVDALRRATANPAAGIDPTADDRP
jgi:hypothetical protein